MLTFRRDQQGFTLLEALMGAFILAATIAFAAPFGQRYLDDRVDQAAASYHKTILDVSKRYMKDNFAAIIAGSSASSPFVLNVTTLKAGNYLPSSWGPVNAYNQTPCVLILQPAPNRLQAVAVTEGGRTMERMRLVRAANLLGAEGGLIDPDIAAPLTAKGSFGSFTIDLTNYVTKSCSGTAATAGHLAAAMLFDGSQVLADFLYRNEVPGYPQANTMNTAINMNGNNINAVNTVNASTVNATTGNITTVTSAITNTGILNTTTVNASGNVNANCFVDRNDANFYVCPSASSVINTLYGSVYYSRENPSYYVQPHLNSRLNEISTRVLYDLDNMAFKVDPSGDSVIRNAYVTDRTNTARLAALLPNFVDTAVSSPQINGAMVTKPACLDSGQPYIYLIPQSDKVPATQIINRDVTDFGATWRVNIVDGVGGGIPSATVFAKTGCYYP